MSSITLDRLGIVFFSSDFDKVYENAKAENNSILINVCEDLMLSRSMFCTFVASTIIWGLDAHLLALPTAVMGLGLSVCVLLTGITACALYEDILRYEGLLRANAVAKSFFESVIG